MPHKCTTCARDFADGSKEMLSGCPDCGGTTFQYLPDGGTITDAAGSAEPSGKTGVEPLGKTSVEPPERPGVAGSTVAETVGRATTKVRDFVSESPDDGGVPGSRDDGAEVTVAGEPEPRTKDECEADSTQNVDDPAENAAQSSARSDMVSSEELPDEVRSTGLAVGSTGNEGVSRGSASGSASESTPKSTHEPARESVDPSEGVPVETDRSVSPEQERRAQNRGASGRKRQRSVRARSDAPTPEGRVVDTPSDESPDISDLREELNDQFEGIRILDPGQYELNLMELYEREETIIALRENGRYVIEPPESWRGD